MKGIADSMLPTWSSMPSSVMGRGSHSAQSIPQKRRDALGASCKGAGAERGDVSWTSASAVTARPRYGATLGSTKYSAFFFLTSGAAWRTTLHAERPQGQASRSFAWIWSAAAWAAAHWAGVAGTASETGALQSVSPVLVTARYLNSTVPAVRPAT